MTSESERIVAQVILKPASGRPITGTSMIRADTLEEFAPDPSEARAVARVLTDAGFEVGPTVGVGYHLTGPRSLFERYFDTKIAEAPDGGWVAVRDTRAATRELPVDKLPDSVAGRVLTVTFDEPAETVSS